MLRTVLKSKIHRARLTGLELNYEGSIAIDENLLEKAGILPFEQVQVLNVNNGARLLTYALVAPRGSGTVMLNGPAARQGAVGDVVIILTYAAVTDEELAAWQPVVLHVDERNQPRDG